MSAADERLTDIILWHGLFAAEDENAELELQHLRAEVARLTEKVKAAESQARVCREDAEINADRAERAEKRLKKACGLLIRETEYSDGGLPKVIDAFLRTLEQPK